MNFLKITIHSQQASYTYYGTYIPGIGHNINFGFANVVGVVTAISWLHVNEVDVIVSPVAVEKAA